MANRICLDYGHGGTDPGASYQGRKEKDDTLKLGLAVAAELRRYGVIMSETRTTDKTMSLKERSDYANRTGCDYFLSIHRNAFKPEQAKGVETFVYTAPSTKSVQLAEKIQAALVKVGFVDRKVKRENFHVLREVVGPAVLVEVGFLDNTTDNQLYDAKWNEIMQAISGAVLAQLGISYNSPAPAPTPAGTPILGPAQATVEQAQAWAQDRGAAGEFIGVAVLYWQEAPRRGGVRPEVAYVQAAKETGFGRFGGVIPGPEWHNWCGLKTTEGGANSDPGAHMKFPDDLTGVRAHLDHLAIYAGASGYPKADSPDPRHFPYIAGTAKTVEVLGGKWAPAADYGTSLIEDYLNDLIGTSASAPKPIANDLPTISRRIGLEVDGRVSGEVGYLIDNATYLRAAYLIGAVGGTVTGHGDHIKITLPEAGQIDPLLSEIATLKQRIENAKQALS